MLILCIHPKPSYYISKNPKKPSLASRESFGDRAACILLGDLSKAFERVNPHWILTLLRIKKAPTWLIAYTKFVLFHRRVTHKVQGRLLPSRTLRQGVDMSRFFSIYLFCLAMDPLFTYLIRFLGYWPSKHMLMTLPLLMMGRISPGFRMLNLVIKHSTQLASWLILMPAILLELLSTTAMLPASASAPQLMLLGRDSFRPSLFHPLWLPSWQTVKRDITQY